MHSPSPLSFLTGSPFDSNPISAILQNGELTRSSLVALRHTLSGLQHRDSLPEGLSQATIDQLDVDMYVFSCRALGLERTDASLRRSESLQIIEDCAMAQERIANDILVRLSTLEQRLFLIISCRDSAKLRSSLTQSTALSSASLPLYARRSACLRPRAFPRAFSWRWFLGRRWRGWGTLCRSSQIPCAFLRSSSTSCVILLRWFCKRS